MNSESQPSYYAIIPASVRYDRNLCANAKLLYGEITALCNQQGYCWASNKYLSELYGVDERTIVRWLDNLKENDYIEVHSKKVGFKWDRKIFLKEVLRRDKNVSGDSQKKSTKGQKCNVEMTKMSARTRQECPHNNTSNTTTGILFVADDPVGSPPIGKISFLGPEKKWCHIDETDVYRKIVARGVDWIAEEVREACKVLQNYEGVVHDWWKFLIGVVQKKRMNKKSKRASGEVNAQGSKSPNRSKGCQTNVAKSQENCKENSLEKNSKEQALEKSTSLQEMAKEMGVVLRFHG